jgi:hypothetical protein
MDPRELQQQLFGLVDFQIKPDLLSHHLTQGCHVDRIITAPMAWAEILANQADRESMRIARVSWRPITKGISLPFDGISLACQMSLKQLDFWGLRALAVGVQARGLVLSCP